MVKIPITSSRPGMKLARPVLNDAGIVVFGKGIALTEEVIGRIKEMSVFSLSIEGKPNPKRPLDEELKALDERFRATEKEPHMSEIKSIIREHIESLYEQ